MNKLMCRFVATRKKKKIDLFLDTVCLLRASCVINVQICSYYEEKKLDAYTGIYARCIYSNCMLRRFIKLSLLME